MTKSMIKSHELANHIASGQPVMINMGAGPKTIGGYFSLDIADGPEIDIVADLNEPLALLPDNSVSHIYTAHTLEHIDNLLGLMKEIHRILVPDGTLHARVPHFSNPYALSDPTHVRFFGLYTMYYFVPKELQPKLRRVPDFYGDSLTAPYRVESIHVTLHDRSLLSKILFPMSTKRINRAFRNQDLYERKYCFRYPADEIEYVMRPLK